MSAPTIGNTTLQLLPAPPLKGEEEAKLITNKQGIVSILAAGEAESEHYKAASLRRTLSADMSSKKWMAQNGVVSPMKKIASSQQLGTLVSDRDEEEFEEAKNQLEKPCQFDVWSSILTQKAKEESSELPPPYVHPLVKRASSSLSEKSLEICTESLGSETGSDGFSSYAASETGDVEDQVEKEDKSSQLPQDREVEFVEREEVRAVKGKKSPPLRSFPPPLPSLPRRDGPSLHMQPRRENGRLVLEAVSVPSQSCFRAQREEGRLRLTLADNLPVDEEKNEVDELEEEVEEEVFDQSFEFGEDYVGEENEKTEEEDEDEEEEEGEEEEDDENEEKEIGIIMEEVPKMCRAGAMNVHRSAIVMKKLIGFDNRNPKWTHKFNKSVNLVEMEVETEEEATTFPQSLPRPPRVARLIPSSPAKAAAATSFNNTYEYFWRTKPTVATVINSLSTAQKCPPLKNKYNKVIMSNSVNSHEQQEMVLLRGNKADYLVPLLKGCKEPRRSLLVWEPYCVATS